MKIIILILCIGLVSMAVFARDLSTIARKERLRRQSTHVSAIDDREFTNDDLEAYARGRTNQNSQTRRETRRPVPRADRDLRKEESFWRKETLRHHRELARLDANIRRLEWRLRDRRLNSRTRNRLETDPGVALMEQSLESLREERERVDNEFRDRARKAGAFPGWLR